MQKTVEISQEQYMGFLSMSKVLESTQNDLKSTQNRLDELELSNLTLKAYIDQLLRMLYGAKSERHLGQQDSSQLMLELGLEAIETPEVQTEDIAAHTRTKSKEKLKPIRTAIPAHLKRVTTVIEPDVDTTNLVKIGEEITEVLELKVPEIYVLRTVRPKYATAQGGVVIADLPPRAIERGNAGAGLLAHLLVSKYVDHLPIYRQVRQFKRWGIELADSTVYEWTASATNYLKIIYDKIVERVLRSLYIQADESPLEVLQGSETKKGTHRGYLWVYHSPPDGIVFFDYRKGRDQSGPKELLKNFKGILQTDGYGVYDAIAALLDIILGGCMAHARRKFDEAKANDKKRAEHILNLIQALYAIERDIKDKETADIYSARQSRSVPILEQMHQWMKEQAAQVTPQSAIAKAIRYSMERWDKLILYTQHGHMHIDNNAIENAIRPLALGRKNFLFAGSHESAQRIAIVYTITGTCKKLGIDPQTYIELLLNELPNRNVNDIDDLLPWNFKKAQDSSIVEMTEYEKHEVLV